MHKLKWMIANHYLKGHNFSYYSEIPQLFYVFRLSLVFFILWQNGSKEFFFP